MRTFKTLGIGCLVSGALFVAAEALAVPGGPTAGRLLSTPAVDGGFGFTVKGTPCEGIALDEPTFLSTMKGDVASGTVSDVWLVHPGSLPFRPTAVCSALAGIGADVPYTIVFFADHAGVPGAQIASIPAVAPGTANDPNTDFTWATTSVDGAVPPIYGPFWVGARFPAPGIWSPLAAQTTPVAERSNDGEWTVTAPPYAFNPFLRVAGRYGSDVPAVPALSGQGLAALAVGVAAAGFLLLRRVV